MITIMKNIEYWGIKKDGSKFLNNIKTKSSRKSKVEKQIEIKENFKINELIDFGYNILID